MVIMAFTRAMQNLLLRGIIKIFLICLCCYIVLWSALAWALGVIFMQMFYPNAVSATLGSLVGVGMAWFLFPLLFPVLISFFDERIAEIIEKNEYPHVLPAHPPFWPTFMQDVRFTAKALFFNILCLPFYFIPFFGQALYYGLNGYMLGMQFFRMAAGRRLPYEACVPLMKAARKDIFLIGLAVSVAATIPLLNFAAPVWGVAAMLHVFYHLQPNTTNAEQQILLPLKQ